MTEINKSNGEQKANEFLISRTFNAPRELVWKVWTEPEHLNQWWGPKGFKMITIKLELKHGGVFHYLIQAPNGLKMWGKFIYQEIIEPEKLVYIVSFSDEKGNITRHPLSNTWPLEVLNTIIFTEYEGKTTITIKGIPINASDEEINSFVEGFDSMRQGNKGMLDQLDEYLLKIK